MALTLNWKCFGFILFASNKFSLKRSITLLRKMFLRITMVQTNVTGCLVKDTKEIICSLLEQRKWLQLQLPADPLSNSGSYNQRQKENKVVIFFLQQQKIAPKLVHGSSQKLTRIRYFLFSNWLPNTIIKSKLEKNNS